MPWVHIVAVLAVLQFLVFGFLVGRARAKYHIHAPAVSGNEHFERALRVQMNTLEQLAAFLPGLLIAAQYFSPHWVAAVGSVYLLGRSLYWYSYRKEPKSRALGFILTVAPTAVLLAMAGLGAVLALLGG